MIRVVLDTNVWVSGSLTPEGRVGRILEAWREKRFETVVSEDILVEIERVFMQPSLRQRIGWTEDDAREALYAIYKDSVVTPGRISLRVVKEDPADDKFFVAAVEGGAGYLVSGDTQIQKINRYRGIRVLSPARFLERLERNA